MPLNRSQIAPPSTRPVAVLLATYNGAAFLDEQLRSILEQTHPRIDIWASDDGSSDATVAILAKWAAKWTKGQFRICAGPRLGFAENFRSLMVSVSGDYVGYCFSDQDDVWLPAKIERALAATADTPSPVLYGARTKLVDVNGSPIGFSPLWERQMGFQNALVQSMAGGNTMTLNPPAFALLAESARRTSFVTHDWWAYMLTTGCGGKAVYDPEPNLLYRQHANNVLGKNSGLTANLRRIGGVVKGQFREWTAGNIAGLEACADMLTPSARITLRHLKDAHTATPPLGLISVFRSRVYRQNLRANAMMWLAGAMGWL
ncbi:glycosyltransferase family 2 protein [Devosia naphthalenivorans]|uniref:glycosyltransferase family 2 protein n=1 Tax=Devosia naphthalenivorans TaxID=2082392 RepID=UPI000D361FA0|nr:glycosyltransferase family 2 protein [Devosia naphthalenivorans]